MNRVQRNCPLCQHEGTFIYNNVMSAVGPFDISYEIRACSHCQSVFADKLAPRLNYDQYYVTGFFGGLPVFSPIKMYDMQGGDILISFFGVEGRKHCLSQGYTESYSDYLHPQI